MYYQLRKKHREKRTSFLKILTADEIGSIREKLLNWLKTHEVFCWLDSHNYYHNNSWPYHSFDLLVGAGERQKINFSEKNIFSTLENEIAEDDWLMGYLGYDVKNETEQLSSKNSDFTAFPEAYFFKPEILFFSEGQYPDY